MPPPVQLTDALDTAWMDSRESVEDPTAAGVAACVATSACAVTMLASSAAPASLPTEVALAAYPVAVLADVLADVELLPPPPQAAKPVSRVKIAVAHAAR